MTTATKIRLWTVEEYHKMISSGILTRDSHVELLEGRIVEMSPQGPLHAGTTQRASDYIKARLHDRAPPGNAYLRLCLQSLEINSEVESRDFPRSRAQPGNAH